MTKNDQLFLIFSFHQKTGEDLTPHQLEKREMPFPVILKTLRHLL
jgi:hypothetical protein